MRAKDLEVCIMHQDEAILKECKAAIENQTLKPARLYEVINVTPLSRAFNLYYENMRLPYVIKVDADVILFPYAFEKMYNAFMEVDQEKYYSMIGFVEDVLVGRTSGLRITKTSPELRAIRLPNQIACDRLETRKMRNQHRKQVTSYEGDEIMGIHRSDWNGISSIVSTFFNTGQKCNMLSDRKMHQFYRLCKKWVETGKIEPLVALICFSHGLFTTRHGEKYSGYDDKVIRHIRGLMGDKRNVIYAIDPGVIDAQYSR